MKTLLCTLLLGSTLGMIPSAPTYDWEHAEITAIDVLNSPGDEYLPAVGPDASLLMFISGRPTDLDFQGEKRRQKVSGDQSHNIWMAPRNGDGSFDKAFANSELSMSGRNEEGACSGPLPGSLVFALDGALESLGESDLYFQTAKRESETVVVATIDNAGAHVNSAHREATPAVAPDGTLYFASDRPGGMGGMDIWFCRYDLAKGEWLPAENAGPKVNSPLDELAPAVSPDGRVLVFSSNGHRPLFGKHDLFVTDIAGHGRYSAPQNLGGRFNTPGEEIGACFAPAGTLLYFASERPSTGFDLFQAHIRAKR